MQRDVQWFISVLVINKTLSKEDCMTVLNSVGSDASLATYAQSLLNALSGSLSQKDLQSLASQFQQLMEFSRQRAASGAVPEMFANMPASSAPASSSPAVSDGELNKLISELRNVGSMIDEQVAEFMRSLLTLLRNFGASDLHISANAPLFIRKDLKLIRLSEDWVVPAKDSRRLNYALLSEEQQKQFEANQDMNFALEFDGGRFRACLMFQKDGVSGAYRIVPSQARTMAELGFMPKDIPTIERLLDYHNGLILVTGPLGSGKTTTLASLIEIVNQRRRDHIITVEDPIEIIIKSRNCQVTQRQIGTCTANYRSALKGALREDPDVIVIGEMHDLETIENAITAAETGHLVIGTLHTCDAANTLNRILDVFPPNQQPQIRAMTAGSLRGIICQRLVPSVNGGVTLVYELMLNTLSVSNTIAEGKIFQLKSAMEIGSKSGMVSLDRNIMEKFNAGLISAETALRYVSENESRNTIMKADAVAQAKRFSAK